MKKCSGKFVLRMPVSLHETLSQISFSKGESLNSLCLELIRLGLEVKRTSEITHAHPPKPIAPAHRKTDEAPKVMVLSPTYTRRSFDDFID